MQEILEYIVKNLVSKPDEVEITSENQGKTKVFKVINRGQIWAGGGIINGSFMVDTEFGSFNQSAGSINKSGIVEVSSGADVVYLLVAQTLGDVAWERVPFLTVAVKKFDATLVVNNVKRGGGTILFHLADEFFSVTWIQIDTRKISAEGFFVLADKVFDEALACSQKNMRVAVFRYIFFETLEQNIRKVISVHLRNEFRWNVHLLELAQNVGLKLAKTGKLGINLPPWGGFKVVVLRGKFRPFGVAYQLKIFIAKTIAVRVFAGLADGAVKVHADNVFFLS